MASTKGQKQSLKTQEQIIQGFNALRAEQRQLSQKIMELETDVTEHKYLLFFLMNKKLYYILYYLFQRLVIEALQEVKDTNRKCFRMIGGVLVERTVVEVLPSLQKNKEMVRRSSI